VGDGDGGIECVGNGDDWCDRCDRPLSLDELSISSIRLRAAAASASAPPSAAFPASHSAVMASMASLTPTLPSVPPTPHAAPAPPDKAAMPAALLLLLLLLEAGATPVPVAEKLHVAPSHRSGSGGQMATGVSVDTCSGMSSGSSAGSSSGPSRRRRYDEERGTSSDRDRRSEAGLMGDGGGPRLRLRLRPRLRGLGVDPWYAWWPPPPRLILCRRGEEGSSMPQVGLPALLLPRRRLIVGRRGEAGMEMGIVVAWDSLCYAMLCSVVLCSGGWLSRAGHGYCSYTISAALQDLPEIIRFRRRRP